MSKCKIRWQWSLFQETFTASHQHVCSSETETSALNLRSLNERSPVGVLYLTSLHQLWSLQPFTYWCTSSLLPPSPLSLFSSSSPGRSCASTADRLTTSCSVSLKITLHKAEAWEDKFNYDTKARGTSETNPSAYTLCPSAENNPAQRKVNELNFRYWIMLHVETRVQSLCN